MKIFVDYNQSPQEILIITSAMYMGDFKIRAKFNDGKEQVIYFKPFLKKSLPPSIKKYLHESLFTSYEIKDGNLNWNNHDLIFPIADLYNGKIEV